MFTMIFAYIGPETTLPLASVFAACVGFVLTFGRSTWSFTRRAWNGLTRGRTQVGKRSTRV